MHRILFIIYLWLPINNEQKIYISKDTQGRLLLICLITLLTTGIYSHSAQLLMNKIEIQSVMVHVYLTL